MTDNQHRTGLHAPPGMPSSSERSTAGPVDRAPGAWWGRRSAVGAAYGALATVAMSVPMLAGTVIGISPMPKPIPAALVARTLGPLPMPLLLALAIVAHLSYGAVAGAAFATVSRHRRLWQAVGYAVLLWALMGLVWLPYLGWGLFGTTITAGIAAATLVLHLIYGATLGLLLRRSALSGPSRS